MPDKSKGLSPTDDTSDLLYRYLSKPRKYYQDLGDNLPEVESPGIFRRYPEVVGNSDFARAVDRIITFAPELRGRARRVLQGPSYGVINKLLSNENPKFNAYDYENSNLAGMYTPDKTISINPREKGRDLTETLVHELSHSVGSSEDDAYALETIIPESVYGLGPSKKILGSKK